MTIAEVIERADLLRPNLISEQQKAEWVLSLEAEYAELTGEDLPEPPEDTNEALLMPFPYDESYVHWLCAKIDYAQEEMQLYSDDMMAANQAKADACAWWRRNNRPDTIERFKGVWL